MGALALYYLSKFYEYHDSVNAAEKLMALVRTELATNLLKSKEFSTKMKSANFAKEFSHDPLYRSAFEYHSIMHFLTGGYKKFLSSELISCLTQALTSIQAFNELYYRLYYFVLIEIMKVPPRRHFDANRKVVGYSIDDFLEMRLSNLGYDLSSKSERITEVFEECESLLREFSLKRYSYPRFCLNSIRPRRRQLT